MTGQHGADAVPEVVQTALAPVGGLDKAAAQLHRLLEPPVHGRGEGKQGVAVEAGFAQLAQGLADRGEAVGADHLEGGRVPQQQMAVVIVKAIQIAALAGTFSHRPKGDLAQPSQFAQHAAVRLSLAAVEADLLAIRGQAEQLAALDRLLEAAALLGQGDGGLGRQPRHFTAADAVEIAAH